jgi:Fe2+ transport system protein FeoA
LKTNFNRADAPDAGPLVSLDRLSPGDTGIIGRVEAHDGIGRRLLDLGFIPGTPVRVVRRAPLGDPVSFELRGSRICLRRTEAARIFVSSRREGATP